MVFIEQVILKYLIVIYRAWTWNVKRQFYPPLLHPDDITFLKDVYASLRPTEKPSMNPSDSPSLEPSLEPSLNPSAIPSLKPSSDPTLEPSLKPTLERSSNPSIIPSLEPSLIPSSDPSSQPSLEPTLEPSSMPSVMSSSKPTLNQSAEPSLKPTSGPSSQPSLEPTLEPSGIPSPNSTIKPSSQPSLEPSVVPIAKPTLEPSSQPSVEPSIKPTSNPSVMPSTCEEDPFSEFVLKIILNDDNTVKKIKKSTCDHLSGKSSNGIKKICRRSVAHDGVGSASEMCPITCSICVAKPSCEDSRSDKFVEKLVIKGGEVKKFKTNVCSSLESKKPSVVARICRKSVSHDGVGSASEVCPVSCKSCKE